MLLPLLLTAGVPLPSPLPPLSPPPLPSPNLITSPPLPLPHQVRPSKEQYKAADALMKGMSLDGAGEDLLRPEDTVNPSIAVRAAFLTPAPLRYNLNDSLILLAASGSLL